MLLDLDGQACRKRGPALEELMFYFIGHIVSMVGGLNKLKRGSPDCSQSKSKIFELRGQTQLSASSTSTEPRVVMSTISKRNHKCSDIGA